MVIVVALAGCKKAAPKKQDGGVAVTADAAATVVDATAVAAVDAAVADAPPVIPDAPPGALVAGRDGVGPLTKDTPYDVKALKKLLPDYQIKKVKTPMGEGDLADIYIGVSKGKTLVLKLVGQDKIMDIDIVSNDVWNPFGVTIGMTYADAEKLVGKLECDDAGEHTDWKANIAECSNGTLDRFTLDFKDDEASEAKELIAAPAQLAKAKVVAIRWNAPGYGPPGTE